jgi:type IV pilus assembly protein PilA
MVSMAWTKADKTADQGVLGAPGAESGIDQGWHGRVIPWSGPAGWRSSPPTLEVLRLGVRRGRDHSSSEAGFSMIELMVVLLVLGILLAIAIPTFLGTRNGAADRSVQSNLGSALTQARAQFDSANQSYYVNGIQDPIALASALSASQPSLNFKAGSLGPTVAQGSSGSLSDISVAVSVDGNGVVLAGYSLPGNCFYVVDNPQALTSNSTSVAPYGTGTAATTTAIPAIAGPIGLPTSAGTFYVDVSGDTTKADCNAYSPKTSGPPATIQYLTTGFPS